MEEVQRLRQHSDCFGGSDATIRAPPWENLVHIILRNKHLDAFQDLVTHALYDGVNIRDEGTETEFVGSVELQRNEKQLLQKMAHRMG